jgi:hypothetical protein
MAARAEDTAGKDTGGRENRQPVTLWRPWLATFPAAIACLLAIVLGTAGYFAVSSRLGIMCRDGLGKGTYDCSTLNAWLAAGAIGQLLLAACALVLLVLGIQRPAYRRIAAISASALIPLSLGWIAITSLAGHSSF